MSKIYKWPQILLWRIQVTIKKRVQILRENSGKRESEAPEMFNILSH